MQKESLSKVFARNLAAAMKAANGGLGINQSELAAVLKNKVPQTTISLYLRPDARLREDVRVAPSPTLERVALIAAALGIEPWLLLHPDPAQAKSAVALIEQVRKSAETSYQTAPFRSPAPAMHEAILEYSGKNPPPVPLPENVRSLRKERNIRASRGPRTAPTISTLKKKKP